MLRLETVCLSLSRQPRQMHWLSWLHLDTGGVLLLPTGTADGECGVRVTEFRTAQFALRRFLPLLAALRNQQQIGRWLHAQSVPAPRPT